MQKKENQKAREEIELYKRLIAQKQEEDGEPLDDLDPVDEKRQVNKQRSHLNTRGSGRSQPPQSGLKNAQSSFLQQPIVYIPKQKVETEDEKVLRYERVIEKLKKMLEHERKLLKGARH